MLIRRTILFAAVPFAAAIVIYEYIGRLLPEILVLACLAALRLLTHTGSGAGTVFRKADGRAVADTDIGRRGASAAGQDRRRRGRIIGLVMISFGLSWCHLLMLDAAGSGFTEMEGETVRITGVIRTIAYKEQRQEGWIGTGDAGSDGSGTGRETSRQARMEVIVLQADGEPIRKEKLLVTCDEEQIRSGAEEDPAATYAEPAEAPSDTAAASGPEPAAPAAPARAPEDPTAASADPAPASASAPLLAGQMVRISGVVAAPQTKTNPNCFDYRQYLKTRGIRMSMQADSVTVDGDSKGSPADRWLRYLSRTKEGFLKRLSDRTDAQTGELLRAMLFGEKNGLDEDIQELFQKNGTAHVLAVSGLHIGIIYGMLRKFWDALCIVLPKVFGTRRDWRFFIFALCFFSSYSALAAFSASVLRASGMVLLHAFAKMTGRRYDLCCAACAVGLAALAVDPWALLGTGFQMSFLAVLTLSMLTPYVSGFTTGILAGSLCIQLGLDPYLLYQFNVISLAALFINIPVIFLTGILVQAGLISMLLPAAGIALDPLIGALSHLMILLNDLCQIDGVTTIRAASPHPVWILSYYALLALFGSETGRLMILRKKQRQAAAAGIILFAFCIALGTAMDDGFRHMEIVFADVGQGDCMHIRTCGRNYLIDGGGSARYSVGEKTLKPYLLKNGVSHIDGAFVTHLHTDHYQGICELARLGMVDRLYLYEGNRVKERQVCSETGLPPSRLVYLRKGHRVKLSGKASLQVLWPEQKTRSEYMEMIKNEEDENASSLIMKVQVNGVSMLATGDLGEEGEQDLLGAYDRTGEKSVSGAGPLHADVLKVGHHGSKYSSSDAFLDAVRPAFAVIQVGRNNMYGHPTPEVLQRLAGRQVPVLRSDLQGAIGIDASRGRVGKFCTMVRMVRW